MFQAARDDAEQQICDNLEKKVDEFLDLENYDWLLGEWRTLNIIGMKFLIARCERGLDGKIKTKSCNDTFCNSCICVSVCLSLS